MKMISRIWYSSYRAQNRSELLFHPYKLRNSPIKLSGNFPVNNNQGLRFISNNMGEWRKLDADIGSKKDERVKDSSPDAGSGGSSKFKFSPWARWLLGSVLSFLLPFWKSKWAYLKRMEGEAEVVVEVAENAAQVVEKVATVAENMSAEAAEKLPDDSQLKKAAMVVEHVSEIAAEDAHATTKFIQQVGAVKHDLDGLEALVEPIVQKIVKEGPQEN
ncbi:hypothetical protein HRI_001135000 [Hibiscus trionum]|uniref:Uncharacterized protein n=1 Tax=Hibiscus trionum TaxID=183268 RepID=A0A9W7LRI5_HIBTR|nr:hypothetical protein HRI_001135000 [Hibiscus trionum]